MEFISESGMGTEVGRGVEIYLHGAALMTEDETWQAALWIAYRMGNVSSPSETVDALSGANNAIDQAT